MLVAVLNTCTKEELEESDDELAMMSPATAHHEHAERRKIIKNKIMAVGRMARVFALLRCVLSICRFLPYHIPSERNPRKCQSSRTYQGQASFRTAHLLWVRKVLGRLSMDSMMRAFNYAFTSCTSLPNTAANWISRTNAFRQSYSMLIQRRARPSFHSRLPQQKRRRLLLNPSRRTALLLDWRGRRHLEKSIRPLPPLPHQHFPRIARLARLLVGSREDTRDRRVSEPQ